MPVYLYRCAEGHEAERVHRMLYSTGVVCDCGAPMARQVQAPRVNWNGSRAGREPSAAVQRLIKTAPERRDVYLKEKANYEEEKRRIGRD